MDHVPAMPVRVGKAETVHPALNLSGLSENKSARFSDEPRGFIHCVRCFVAGKMLEMLFIKKHTITLFSPISRLADTSLVPYFSLSGKPIFEKNSVDRQTSM